MYVPDFTPRKAEFGKLISKAESASDEQKQPVSSLSFEQKEDLRKQLHYGNGDMTLQEWDDFLADLVEHGIITNSERFYANGFIFEMPERAQTGSACLCAPSTEAVDQMWDGDPLKWLQQMDTYFLQNSLYDDMRCANSMGFSGQRDAYVEVQSILKDILPENGKEDNSTEKAVKLPQNVHTGSDNLMEKDRVKIGTSLAVLNQQQLNLIQNSMCESVRFAMLDSARKASGREAAQKLSAILNEILW